MSKVLQIGSSARIQGSTSRTLTQQFVKNFQQHHPDSQIIRRDLTQPPIPHIDATWVAAYEAEPGDRTPEMNQALTLSNCLIDELLAADRYVIGVPMYNLTIPSSLKAYIDQIVRRDRTLRFGPDGRPQPVLQNKKALIIATRKFNYRPGSPAADRNFLEPYLKAILGVIGIEDVTVVVADELAKAESRDRNLAQAQAQLAELAQSW